LQSICSLKLINFSVFSEKIIYIRKVVERGMDGTWLPKHKRINYVVCPSCRELVKENQIIKNGYKACWRCAQV